LKERNKVGFVMIVIYRTAKCMGKQTGENMTEIINHFEDEYTEGTIALGFTLEKDRG
jgi:hypothetical protein